MEPFRNLRALFEESTANPTAEAALAPVIQVRVRRGSRGVRTFAGLSPCARFAAVSPSNALR